MLTSSAFIAIIEFMLSYSVNLIPLGSPKQASQKEKNGERVLFLIFNIIAIFIK